MLMPKINDYTVIKEIGCGHESRVYLVESQNKNIFAIKTIFVAKENQFKIPNQAIKYRSLKHPNIIPAYECFFYQNNTRFAIVLQYCPEGTLASLMMKNQLQESKIQEFTLQIAQGLTYLHKKNIIHRDIKPQNILIKDGVAKIADLGLSKNFDSELISSNKGSLYYQAPETLENLKHYEFKSDLYSFGIVVLEMCLGKRILKIFSGWLPPAKREDFPSDEILQQIKSEKLRNLILMMLTQKPEERITALEVFNYIQRGEKIEQYREGGLFINLNSSKLSDQDLTFRESLSEASKFMGKEKRKILLKTYIDFLEKDSFLMFRQILNYHKKKMKLKLSEEFQYVKENSSILKLASKFSNQTFLPQTQIQRFQTIALIQGMQNQHFQRNLEKQYLDNLKFYSNSPTYYQALNTIFKIRASLQPLAFGFNQTYLGIKYFYDKYHSNQNQTQKTASYFVGYSVKNLDYNIWKQLKEGDYIQSLGFISLSKKREVAYRYTKQKHQSNKKKCLLAIKKSEKKINPKFIQYDHGFVDLNDHNISDFPDESEVVLNALNILKVTHFDLLQEFVQQPIPVIHLEYGAIFDLDQKNRPYSDAQRNSVQNSGIPPELFQEVQQGICRFQ